MICPKCGCDQFNMGNDASRRMGLGGIFFCPECGYRETIGQSTKRDNAEIRAREKQKVIDEFKEIMKKINGLGDCIHLDEGESEIYKAFDGIETQLNEWFAKVMILLEML